jgi:hypothetical protein
MYKRYHDNFRNANTFAIDNINVLRYDGFEVESMMQKWTATAGDPLRGGERVEITFWAEDSSDAEMTAKAWARGRFANVRVQESEGK